MLTPPELSDPSLGVTILTAYIPSHPNLKAIGLQHGGVTAILPEALQKAGKKPGEITIGGADLGRRRSMD